MVNEAVAVTTIKTNIGEEYAFVVGRNNRLLGSKIPSIDGDPRAGSNVGIFRKNASGEWKLRAATLPIPNGYAVDLSISSDRRYLTVNYAFAGTFVFDIEKIIETINNSTFSDRLDKEPIDNINPAISIAATPEINGETFPKNSPIDNRGAYGTAPQSRRALIEEIEAEVRTPQLEEEEGEIILKWTPKIGLKFPPEPETEPELEPETERRLEIPNLGLYISTFPEGEGLKPGDWSPEGFEQGRRDFNPNRVLTAQFIQGAWQILNEATGNFVAALDANGNPQTDRFEFRLPKDRKLTAGQTYYWTVEVKGAISSTIADAVNLDFGIDSDSNTFTVPLGKLNSPPSESFSSVTMITDGLETGDTQNQLEIKQNIYSLAKHITKEEGLVLQYDRAKGNWIPVEFQDIDAPEENTKWWIPSENMTLDYEFDEPLVLLADWTQEVPDANFNLENLRNAGFAEAAADTLFASLIDLDIQQGGTNQYYTDGSLKRTQGAILNSPLHFIGFGQGAVVNTEIVQRLGTFYPKEKYNFPDIHVTTIDPFSYSPSTAPVSSFKNIYDPSITVWDNITYADNYFQKQGTGRTTNGFNISKADINISLSNPDTETQRAGFDEATNTGEPHRNALTWYLGTSNLSYGLDELHDINRVYRRLGDLYLTQGSDVESTATWYTPDYKNPPSTGKLLFEHGDKDAPWEGIGTGWFYSVLGGGYNQRTYKNTNKVSVSKDNTRRGNLIGNRFLGDRAVPTLYNGNFDTLAFKNTDSVIPGWSIFYEDNPQLPVSDNDKFQNNAIQDHLITWNKIDTLKTYLDKLGNPSTQNYALTLGGTEGARAITHNNFILPDEGDLYFDLHAKNISGGTLIVTIGNEDFKRTQRFKIQRAESTPSEYENDKVKIGYGEEGFETFIFNLSDSDREQLHNQQITLSFKLQGAVTSTIYLDNVGFKTIINPTNAKPNQTSHSKNFLIKKPQFNVSYNQKTNTANWVSWQLNNTWLGDEDNRPNFTGDPDIGSWFKAKKDPHYTQEKTHLQILEPGVFVPPDSDAQNSFLEGGHLAPRGDFSRHKKDETVTFLTTNIVPQDLKLNRGEWEKLELELRRNIDKGKNYHIIAGAFGTNSELQEVARDPNTKLPLTNADGVFIGTGNPKEYIEAIGNTKEEERINVPAYFWKVIAEVPDIDSSIEDAEKVFVVRMPNKRLPNSQPKWEDWQIPLNKLETELNQNSSNFTYKFPNKLHSLSASLLASSQFDVNSISSDLAIPNTSIGHDGVVEGNKDEIRVGIASPFEVHISEPSVIPSNFANISPSEVGSIELGGTEIGILEIGSSEVGSSKIRTSQSSLKKDAIPQVSISEVGIADRFLGQPNSFQVSPTQVNSIQRTDKFEGSISESNPTQIDSFEIKPFEIDSTQSIDPRVSINSKLSEVSFPSSISFEQILYINPISLHNSTPKITNVLNNSAINIWSDLLQPPTKLDIDFQITDLPTGQLAEATITDFDENGTPNAGTIQIDHDANGVGWFIDPTPWENSEFAVGSRGAGEQGSGGEYYFIADPESEANGKYDLLTTVLHELAHLYGFIEGYSGFDGHVEEETFISDDFSAILDGEHLDKKAHPHDLLNTHLAPGIRKLPSQLDIQILQSLIASEAERNPNNPGGEKLLAQLTSDPLLAAIINGDFSIGDIASDDFGWNTRGATRTLDGTALLTEESPFLSNITQTFTVPESAKTLQFTLTDIDLIPITHFNL